MAAFGPRPDARRELGDPVRRSSALCAARVGTIVGAGNGLRRVAYSAGSQARPDRQAQPKIAAPHGRIPVIRRVPPPGEPRIGSPDPLLGSVAMSRTDPLATSAMFALPAVGDTTHRHRALTA